MGFISRQEPIFDQYRFGIMSIMIMIQACYASIGAYMSILNDMWVLVALEAIVAMGSNAMFLAQAKAKVCLIGFWLSMLVSTIVIIITTIMFIV